MEAKQSKIIVRDNSGNLIQLLPEVKVDSSINQSSSNPVSGRLHSLTTASINAQH